MDAATFRRRLWRRRARRLLLLETIPPPQTRTQPRTLPRMPFVTRCKVSWTSFSAGPKVTRPSLPSLGSVAAARRIPSSSPCERGWPSSRCALFWTRSGWWPSDAGQARTFRGSLSYPQRQSLMPPSTVGVCAQPQSTGELWTARLGGDRRWSRLSGPGGSPARCPPRCPHTTPRHLPARRRWKRSTNKSGRP
jgi:hypothetical protein